MTDQAPTDKPETGDNVGAAAPSSDKADQPQVGKAEDKADNTADTPKEAPDLPEGVDTWKPEPREWRWNDIFTAPMLAFKPKCMIISLVTILLIGGFNWLWYGQITNGFAQGSLLEIIGSWIGILFNAIIFSLGATLVATFFRADLLDDEFLSLSEGITQWQSRITSAILVPCFMVGVLITLNLIIYAAQLVSSIPAVGALIYFVMYALLFLLALFTILLSIAFLLAIFVGPGVLAVRRHKWFDNVIDTFEAVGTKPQVIVCSLILTCLMGLVAYSIGNGSMALLSAAAESKMLPGSEVIQAERLGTSFANETRKYFDPIAHYSHKLLGHNTFPSVTPYKVNGVSELGGWTQTTGYMVGLWKIFFAALVSGYVLNIFIGGGLLTYLATREDDYWDDEDLEDLDALAQELEAEAQRDLAAASAAAGDESSPASNNSKDAQPDTTSEQVESEESSVQESNETTTEEATRRDRERDGNSRRKGGNTSR